MPPQNHVCQSNPFKINFSPNLLKPFIITVAWGCCSLLPHVMGPLVGR